MFLRASLVALHRMLGRPLQLTTIVEIACCALIFAQNTQAQDANRASTKTSASDSSSGGSRATIDFSRDVYPVLQRSCIECHGPKKAESDLRLDRPEFIAQSGTVQPGKPLDSELLRRVSLKPGDPDVMPKIGQPLSPDEVARLRLWIELGAVWPVNFQAGNHWAYVAPTRPNPPPVSRSAWTSNEIDSFVLARLEAEGLEPSPQAEATTLVRRVFFDLIGLPPSPDEVDRFLTNGSTNAYEQLVDELLGREQFGERWARPWLDLARYADSHGFQRDDLREIWAYRDWVIRALNADMPFDQFTIEQLAGDLLPGATEAQRIATGFHRCVPTNVEAGSLPEETRIEQVIDRVNTTGAVWLGSTLECSQCHDHKYDPFTAKDYYRLLAYFNNTEPEADLRDPKVPSSIAFRGPSMPIADPARDDQRSSLQKQLDEVKAQLDARKTELAKDLDTWAIELARSMVNRAVEHHLDISSFESQGTGDSYQRLDDKSILLVGDDPPGTDVYTLRATSNLAGIRAVRIEALTHPSLPGGGPGRANAGKPNFVLHEFTATVKPVDSSLPESQLGFSAAQSDFAQMGWQADGLIDGNPKTGWAISPQFGQPHWALLVLDRPLDTSQGLEFTFKLDQHLGAARTIGRLRLSLVTGDPTVDSLPGDIASVLEKPAQERTTGELARLIEYRAKSDSTCKSLDQQAGKLDTQLKTAAAEQTLVMIEQKVPRTSSLFVRGDYRQAGEQVEPGTPKFLHPLPPGSQNRLTLARWLVDPCNPLVARVAVNRWWAELFGTGIVSTVEDFGVKGASPSHPELLDWLAVEFVEAGWSMKHILKTIVMSSTYRQSSHATQAMLQRDDQNRLLARGPRFRMDAEMIRDNALSIAGLLSLKQFGPPIRPYQPAGIWNKVGGEQYVYEVSPGSEQDRRGIYVVLKRGAPFPSFINFDASARLACTVKRSRTNTPMQALDLLNDPVYVRAAQALAARVIREKPKAPIDERLEYAMRLCAARTPNSHEANVLRQLYADQREASRSAPNSAEQHLPEFVRATDVSADEFAAWYCVATTLLNLHETITKD